MPRRMFNFKCNACDQHFEALAEVGTTPKCRHCESEDVTYHIGAPMIVSGVKGLSRLTPDGFKEVLKPIRDKVPEKKRGKFSAI